MYKKEKNEINKDIQLILTSFCQFYLKHVINTLDLSKVMEAKQSVRRRGTKLMRTREANR
jgi:hypothetical protein